MHKALIAGLMAAASLPLMAQAPAPQPPMAPRAPMAPMADKIVTRGEMLGMVQTRFAKADANRDGFIAGDEIKARREGMMGKRGMRGQHAGGGDPARAFDRLDANRDGMISRDEFARGRELRSERRTAIKGQRGEHRMGMRGMGMMGGRMLRMADANKDGRVSMQEATSGALQHFDMMDSNRDGRLTPEERRANRGKRMNHAG